MSNWKIVLKIEGTTSDNRKIDSKPEEIMDYVGYRNWAWQSDKARKHFKVSGEGFEDKEHLDLLDKYVTSPQQKKKFLMTWNSEFGEKIGAVYPTGGE